MGDLAGLGWAEGVVASQGGAVVSLLTLENKGEVPFSLAWCLFAERARTSAACQLHCLAAFLDHCHIS